MRTIILSLAMGLSAFIIQAADMATNYNAALYGPRAIVDTDMQTTVDSWFKGAAATNGIVCAVQLPSTSQKRPPAFYVTLLNTTTNFIQGWVNLPFEAFASIALFDSDGKLVAKTAAGEKVGTWTQQQIEDQFYKGGHPMVKSRGKTSTLFPLLDSQVGGEISILKMFQIKQAGEYTLHLRMRFVRVTEDTSDKFFGEFIFQTIWLPEVVAKIQIRPEDIPPPDLPPNTQTNSSLK